MRAPSVAIYFVNATLTHLQDKPWLRDRLLRQNHIPTDMLSSPTARIPGDDFANLVRDVVLETRDEQMGHAYTLQPVGSWVTMTQLAIGARDLHEALRRMARFYRLVPWGMTTRLKKQGDEVHFVVEPGHDFHVNDYLYESFVFYIYRFSNWLINQQIPLIGVNFPFAETPQRQEYRYLYFTGNIHFNQPRCALRFPVSLLQEKVCQDDYSLRKFLNHAALSILTQRFQQKNWRSQVEHALLPQLPENPDIVDIASQLKVHPHTLRSYLRREGVQFKEVRENLRCEVAIDLLRHENTSIEETALRLGYSETSAFSRAFKRWMGISPLAYRRGEDEQTAG